jgi:hypothetical protein
LIITKETAKMPLVQFEDEKYSNEQKETMHIGSFMILLGLLAYIFHSKIYKYIKIASKSKVHITKKDS